MKTRGEQIGGTREEGIPLCSDVGGRDLQVKTESALLVLEAADLHPELPTIRFGIAWERWGVLDAGEGASIGHPVPIDIPTFDGHALSSGFVEDAILYVAGKGEEYKAEPRRSLIAFSTRIADLLDPPPSYRSENRPLGTRFFFLCRLDESHQLSIKRTPGDLTG